MCALASIESSVNDIQRTNSYIFSVHKKKKKLFFLLLYKAQLVYTARALLLNHTDSALSR